MRIINLPRGAGKTRTLVEMSAETGQTIVCRGPRDVKWIMQEAHDMRKHIPEPITYDDFLNRRFYGTLVEGFLIDNLDQLLRLMSGGVDIDAVTITGELTYHPDDYISDRGKSVPTMALPNWLT